MASAQVGTIDGPRIASSKSKIKGFFKILENKLYHTIPTPDLLLSLDVDLQTAIARNNERLKQGKETPEEIKERFEQYKSIKIKTKKMITIDNRHGANQVSTEITEDFSQCIILNLPELREQVKHL